LYRPEHVGLRALSIFVLIAVLDALVPGAQRSPNALRQPVDSGFFRWLPRLYVPLQLVLIVSALYVAMEGSVSRALTLGAAVGVVAGGVGITLAHELGHSKSRLDRLCGWVLMTSVGYGHFMVEHYRGHHPRAATVDDPASARRGETVYRFWLRTLTGSLLSAIALESKRIDTHKSSWLRSPLLWSFSGSLAMLAAPLVFFPASALQSLAFVFALWLVAVLLLETVNYIEHYGLLRVASENGKREPFGMMHAWNADHVFTNSLLLNLQRHSDHHMHAWKPYETLEPLPGPQLPTGYAGCILLALVPPIWFGLMHPKLDALAARN
jgi:alkane 1-monooxygenase